MGTQEQRPPIPEPMKREVRQRCGFGCVICGLPLYDYEHMTPFSEVQQHTAENLTLLCPTHHREKTNGLRTEEQVREDNASQLNLREGQSGPYGFRFSGDTFELYLGGNVFLPSAPGQGVCALMVDGVGLLGFEVMDGCPLLHLLLFDEANQRLLQVVRNELIYSTDAWDVERVGRRFIVRTGPRCINLDVQFEPPNRVLVNSGRLLFNGVEVFIHPKYFVVPGGDVRLCASGNTFQCAFGVVVGDPRPPERFTVAVRMPAVSRYLRDRQAALRQAVGELNAFRAQVAAIARGDSATAGPPEV